jgi:hypothetical protein
MASPVEIVFCYAREDEMLRQEIEKQLRVLKRQGLITVWHDRDINAGTEWEREIDKRLNTAHIILLLISPDFMDSDYCYSVEMQRAMERHERGEASVIPIILRPVYWQGAPFGKLQALPTDAKPVASHQWHSLDDAFFDVAEGIRKAVEEQQKKMVGISQSLITLSQLSISSLYANRGNSYEDMMRDLASPNLSEIQIISMALGDLLLEGSVGHKVWKMIQEYILDPTSREGKRLDIKVLVIDPNCFGAYLWSVGEQRKQDIGGSRLSSDIRVTTDSLRELRRIDQTNVSFDFRLYQLPPQVFLFRTNIASYVEPYYFWTSRSTSQSMMVFRFQPDSKLHQGMKDHFDLIWRNASISSEQLFNEHYVGIDKGVRERGIINVFASSKDARERILWLIEHTRENLYIQGFSLHSYFDGDSELYWAIRKLTEQKQVKIKILLIDPESEQAKYRAWREHILQQEDLGETPLTWEEFGSGPLRETQLYSDTKRSIQWVRSITTGLSDTETFCCKLNTTAPYCFMLMSDSSVLVEQYHYGKINQPVGTKILGNMPILEYKRFDDLSDLSNETEQSKPPQTYQLMKSHFEFVFEKCANNIPPRS